MSNSTRAENLLAQLDDLNAQQLRRLLVEHLTRQKLGLYWEANAIERDAALNANLVLPRLVEDWSHTPPPIEPPPVGVGNGHPLPAGEGWGGGVFHRNLIIEGDNFDSLRLLKATHAGKIRVIYIDPPYNTGNKDWVYNDHYVGANDRWRHSQWLEFLYRRLTLARDLLTTDGVILVSINDENRARLELLMDEVFPGMRVGSQVWRTRDTTSAKGRNFSDVHEHILIYARESFAFNGREKTQKKYKNPDSDPRGPWNGDPLTLAFDRFQRQNLFYPIQNPKTGRWYPCDSNRVWAYATESRVKNVESLQAETMEEWIRREKILFPTDEQVVTWHTLDELLAAIDSGDIPVTPKRKRPLLTRDTPDLEFWVGKPIGFGRPLFKKHWVDLQSHMNPVSSWVSRVNEIYDEDDFVVMRSPQAGEGTEVIQEILGSKVFQYPKPPTLILELLRQATKQNDIVLDFFAGSGTTGQAVLELNAEDATSTGSGQASTVSAQAGQRRFILCSSTEATEKEPDKNLCRDVCAERMRRVMQGYGGKAGYTLEQGGEFAYLQLDKVEAADVHFETDAAHAFQLLALKRLGVVCAMPQGAVKRLGRVEDCELLVCNEVNADTIDVLAAWPAQHGAARLAVYSTRPKTLQEQLAARGVEANCYSLMDALLTGQRGAA
jgi:adenine-specific DNA-methyltransferase